MDKQHNPSSLWKGAAAGLIVFAVLFWAMQTYETVKGDFALWEMAAYYIGGLVLLGAAAFAAWLLLAIIRWLPWYFTVSAAVVSLLVYELVDMPQNMTMAVVFLTALGIPALLGASLQMISANDAKSHAPLKRLGGWTAICLCSLALVSLGFWLFQAGSSEAFAQNSSAPMNSSSGSEQNPANPGPYETKTLTYGSGDDRRRPEFAENAAIKTAPVDGSRFIKGWRGIPGWLRTYYWGFDSKSLPLNGRVWFPEGKGPFPLVLFVHGNHEMGDFSDNGYEYLASLLASQGFIAASVDENFLNSSWIDLWTFMEAAPARGWLLLEHLNLWRTWNAEEGNPFFGRVDLDKIALIGHSRGGEAIAAAAALNKLPYFPDDATIPFHYDFNIRSLAAIAPVDGQYKPADLSIPLENINYFTIHGSYDGDVRSFNGSIQYERVKFTDGSYWFKSTLYVSNANHGQFNQEWGRYDDGWPEAWFLNTSALMPMEEQEKIAQVYLSAYLKATLLGEKQYIPLFQDYRFGQAWLPRTIYLSQFEDSNTQYIVTNENTLDITKTALPGGSIEADNMASWAIGKIKLRTGKDLMSTQAIGWEPGKKAVYQINIPAKALKADANSFLFLTLAEGNFEDIDNENDAGEETPEEKIDFTIEISDANGQTAKLPLSKFMILIPQLKTDVYKAQLFDELPASEAVFQTFQLPLKYFAENNPSLNLQDITTIRFIFDKTVSGSMLIGKIGLRN